MLFHLQVSKYAMLRYCVAVQVQAALERVRAGADVMPRAQLEGVLVSELGADWHTRLAEFEWEPRAAASIGQVRRTACADERRSCVSVPDPPSALRVPRIPTPF